MLSVLSNVDIYLRLIEKIFKEIKYQKVNKFPCYFDTILMEKKKKN